MATDKLLIVQPKVGKNQLSKFVKNLENEGVKHIYADPKVIPDKKSKIKTVFTTPNADYVVIGKDGKKVLARMWILRKLLNDMNVIEAMEFIQDRMRRTKTNDEFMETMSQ